MLALLAAVLAFITIGSVGWVLVGGDDSSAQAVKRAQTFGGPKVDNGRLKKQSAANTPEARRKQIVDQLQEADRADRKARMSLKARIRHAGLSLNVRTFWIISGGLGGFWLLGLFWMIHSLFFGWCLFLNRVFVLTQCLLQTELGWCRCDLGVAAMVDEGKF